jgi:hypothetical protein
VEVDKERLKELRQDSIPVRPVYEPYNEAAKTLVDLVHQSLLLEADRPSSVFKQKLIVCGFLAAAQRAFSKEDGGIAISSANDYWSQYPRAGSTVAKQVQEALVSGEYISLVDGTGKMYVWKDDEGMWNSAGVMSIYTINESLLTLDGFVDAEFIEVARPTVQVSIYETKEQRYARKAIKKRTPKMRINAIRESFGKAYGVASVEVESLNTFWCKHPLALPQIGNGVRGYAACATRVYHNGALNNGGRYYGAWTTMEGSYRLQCTIDDEPVAQIDLNASQPTLFSSMMGMKMKVGEMWEDLYTYALEAVDLHGFDIEDDNKTRRNKIKQVTVELIGTGNAHKLKEAEDSKYSFLDGEFARYRNGLLKVVPALHLLNKTYFNGAGYVSFHESQMMMLTLRDLKDMGIPAYPVHDCLIVKETNVETATNVYRDTIRNYIKEHGNGSVDITVPVSIERSGVEKKHVAGYYS